MASYDLNEYLRQRSYPGRGIVLGRSPDNQTAVIAYFIMGRSENSRNRVFEETEDGIRTRAFDERNLTDPSLIIYHPLRRFQGMTIVTNGDQTDTIRDFLAQGRCYRHALLTRAFEPDAPHYTPRISGVVKPDGSYNLSILKSLDGDPGCCCRYFYEYEAPPAGRGQLLHTYQDDGDPLPSFRGEPISVDIPAEGLKRWAGRLWDSLNADNRVALYAEYLDIRSQSRQSLIINRHQEG